MGVGVPVIAMLMALALAGSPVEGAVSAKPVAGNSIESLFSADDYPPGAANRGEQGKVQVAIHIDEQGAVSSCEIKVSSGFPELDTQTCTIIALRAKFLPARDAQGRPVTSELTKTIIRRLANGNTPSGPWSHRLTVTYDADGKPISCHVENAGTMHTPTPPPPCPSDMATRPAPELPGVPAGVRTITMLLELTPGALAPLQLARSEILLERSVAALQVDATGRIASCEAKESSGPMARASICAVPVIVGDFEVRKGPDGKPAPYVETVAMSLIARVAPAEPTDGDGPKH